MSAVILGGRKKGLSQRVAAGARCYVTRTAAHPALPFFCASFEGGRGSWTPISASLFRRKVKSSSADAFCCQFCKSPRFFSSQGKRVYTTFYFQCNLLFPLPPRFPPLSPPKRYHFIGFCLCVSDQHITS